MGIELSPRIIDHGFRKKRESSCLAFLDVGILFGCILSSVPPLYLPTNQPLAYRANRPRQYSNGQSSPANAKRNTTRARKRSVKENSVVPDMPHVVLGKGKRVNTRGSGALVTWGVQFNRETLSRTQKTFTDGLRSPCRRFPSLISRWS